MNILDLQIGIDILQEHYTNENANVIHSNDDELYFDPTDTPLEEHEILSLYDAGWCYIHIYINSVYSLEKRWAHSTW